MDDNTKPKANIQRRLGISPYFVIVMTTFIDMIGFGMIIPILPFHPETAGAGALALGLLIGSFSLMQFAVLYMLFLKASREFEVHQPLQEATSISLCNW